MNSLVHTTSSTTLSPPRRSRGVGWSSVATGVALIIVGEKPYFPASFSLLILLTTLVLYLGMIPVARWIANGAAARDLGDGARVARAAEVIGITGVLVAAATAALALPRWLPAVPAQVLDTSSLGVIGLWLLVANALALRLRLFNRALAVLGALSGLSWLLAAVIMWAELAAGNLGTLIPTLEAIRMIGGYLAELFYLLWVLWLGIWLLVRKR